MVNEAADYLLEKHGIISLPEEIDHEAWEMLLYRITQGRTLHPDKALRLFCRGDGGFSRDMLAVVDLIQADGNVDGMLAGAAISSAAVVWASCKRRFAYPNGRLGIHPIWKDGDTGDFRDLRAQMEELEALDNLQCQIFADAAHGTAGWWVKKLYEPGDLKWLMADELIEIGMARPVSERTS